MGSGQQKITRDMSRPIAPPKIANQRWAGSSEEAGRHLRA